MLRKIAVLISLACAIACAERPAPWDEAAALRKGGGIATATAQALVKRLTQAMDEGGAAHAASFCMVAAPIITDSVADARGVRVKRVSDRQRAAHNAPDPHEGERLREVLDRIASGIPPTELTDQVFELRDSIAFYRPILIGMPLCLVCHGVPGETLDSAAHATILARHPGDAAIGYAAGDFRGLWSIRWPR
ncbi:MAG: DUF3365 domain-containing protein [Flavobacteriales bacterium]|nr:DUF3365 domain-containing protein [Flavobacteriales bacterium]